MAPEKSTDTASNQYVSSKDVFDMLMSIKSQVSAMWVTHGIMLAGMVFAFTKMLGGN